LLLKSAVYTFNQRLLGVLWKHNKHRLKCWTFSGRLNSDCMRKCQLWKFASSLIININT
jgi:hypothetical protein